MLLFLLLLVWLETASLASTALLVPAALSFPEDTSDLSCLVLLLLLLMQRAGSDATGATTTELEDFS